MSKNGKRQLCLRYTLFRQTTYLGLGISIDPHHWSVKKELVLSGDKSYSYYNRILE
ncbi:hypothetical protein JGH11_02945 [Dysgonomonas sp. Marseille-P4677]|uniref:Arm DNA-binding domain-containing protein n=1 Tax=Dysgonomonas sp. Marseille-P4677 TaxID=2364790 RepID=UPI001912B104|nr:hypothetical protein [Dysgonomonas sp. Marseille-P4677]